MTMDSALIFELWGEYGHFRKYYTTTSPLTYAIPPRTALCGLIGAIVGLSKKDYLLHFSRDDADFAISLVRPVKKTHFAENLIDTKKAGPSMNRIQQRTQIRFELLKDPHYRVYFSHSDPVFYNRVKEMIIAHKSVYTPCLGLTEHIANFKFLGETRIIHRTSPTEVVLKSVVPDDLIENLQFEDGYEYMTESAPNEMTPDRVVIRYRPILFERKGRPIRAIVKEYWETGDGDAIVYL